MCVGGENALTGSYSQNIFWSLSGVGEMLVLVACLNTLCMTAKKTPQISFQL